MKKILFLGYSKKETKIIETLKENKNYQIFNTNKKINLKNLDNVNLVISFGYKHIISEDILKKKKNIINLHISYLPYNKGHIQISGLLPKILHLVLLYIKLIKD